VIDHKCRSPTAGGSSARWPVHGTLSRAQTGHYRAMSALLHGAALPRITVWELYVAGALLIAGCTSITPQDDSAAHAASAFTHALDEHNGVRACSLLTPEAVSTVEQSEGRHCSSAIVSMNLPQQGRRLSAHAFGVNAVVTTDSDVLFLTASGGSWKVFAAGCTPQPHDRPYSCLVTAG
jgi:hypothetical protein